MATVREHLQDLRRRLQLIMSVVIVAVEALIAQNADADSDVARVLGSYAGNKVDIEIEGIESLLRRLGAASTPAT